jgi:membrane protease YdiL (CAAX protease family)
VRWLCWIALASAAIAGVLIGVGLAYRLYLNNLPHAPALDASSDLVALLVVAPVSETFLWQFLVIEFSLLFTRVEVIAIGLSVLAFSAAHFASTASLVSAIPGIFGGSCLACAYVSMRRRSTAVAFASLVLLHSGVNLMLLFCLKMLG